jgi:hypothetical protein
VPSGSATSPSITSKPKTRAGEGRPVDIDADSVKALAAWRAQQQKEAEEWGDSYINLADDDGAYNLVFNRENGEPLNPHRAYSTFVGLVKEAGLSHLKLHGLRHINISLQLDAGVSETVIAARARSAEARALPGETSSPRPARCTRQGRWWRWGGLDMRESPRLRCGLSRTHASRRLSCHTLMPGPPFMAAC